MVDRFRVGIITGTHGLKGEVRVLPTTDDPDRFRSLKNVLLTGAGKETPAIIERAGRAGRFIVLKLRGTDTIEQAVLLKGRSVEIDRADAVELEEGEHFIPDLIGCEVVTEEGRLLGRLTDVILTGANDVYEVSGRDGTLLLPVIPECIKSVDTEGGRITVALLPGLEEIYRN